MINSHPSVLGILTGLFGVAALTHVTGPAVMAKTLWLDSRPDAEHPTEEASAGQDEEILETVEALPAPAAVAKTQAQPVAGSPPPPAGPAHASESVTYSQTDLRAVAAAMPPIRAALMIENLQTEEAASILRGLSPAMAGMILAEMSPAHATRIAQVLAASIDSDV
ncbi:MAG: hypothetical protein AAF788_00625 [Pseudomonadota bacterium]